MPKTKAEQSNKFPFRIFKVLKEMTKEYPFKGDKGDTKEPQGVSPEALREYRLKRLLVKVRNKAVRKYYRSPKQVRSIFSQEDWIQEAFAILFQVTMREYKPVKNEKISYYNVYLLQILEKRLVGLLSDLIKKTTKRNDWDLEARVEEEVQETNEVRERFQRKKHIEPVDQVESHEQQVIAKIDGAKQRKALIRCLMKLEKLDRLLIIQLVIKKRTLKDISQQLNIHYENLKSYKKRHLKRALLKLKNCFLKEFPSPGSI